MNYLLKPLFISTLFLLLIVVKCNNHDESEQFDKLRILLNDIATKGELINGILKLEKELGAGGNGIVWKGTMLEKRRNDIHERPVAIKVSNKQKQFKKECDIWSRLRPDSGNVEDVEKYGIPAVFYNGTFDQNDHKYPVIVSTLLELDLYTYNLVLDSFQTDNQIRMFYQLVSTLRYIHSRGVVHNDLKLENIMFRGGQMFIIDFDLAEHIATRDDDDLDNYGANLMCCSIGTLKFLPRYFMDDLKALYFMLLTHNAIDVPWKDVEQNGELFDNICKKMLNRTSIRGLSDKLKSDELKTMYKYFHDAVYDPYPKDIDSIKADDRKPNYTAYLNKALEFIKDLSGSKDTSIYWPLETIVKTPRFNKIPIEDNVSNNRSNFDSELEHLFVGIANQHSLIDDTLAPLPNKKLWNTGDAIFWQGKFYSKIAHDGKDVAIKASNNAVWLTREHVIYEMMEALSNPDVEKYGIQAVYASVDILPYKAIAFTLCKERLIDRKEISSANILRVLYQAILTLKYVHSKGIVHENLTPESFLIHGSRLFISGFEYAEYNRFRSNHFPLRSNVIFGSICTALGKHGSFMDDFKSLFYIMLHFLGIELPWEHLTDISEIMKLKIKFKENYNLCFKIKDQAVQRVLKRYYKLIMVAYKNENDTNEVKTDLRKPFYTALCNIALAGIQKITKSNNTHFDWPSDVPKIEIPPIDSIDEPKQKTISVMKK